MLIQETSTDLPPEQVIERAREFFTNRASPYAGFVDSESDTHVRFRFEAGSLSVGAGKNEGYTWVRGSTTRLHHELSLFLLSLAPRPEEVRQNLIGPATSGAG